MVETLETKTIAPMCALLPGVRLQEYVIRSVIGEGGFGIVYLAHDTLLDREVAIKEYLPATLAMRTRALQVGCRVAAKRELFEKGLRHFVDEAQILARFRHPGLVAVLRFIEANGTAYMVMPYYRGTTLHEMIRTGYQTKTAKDLLSILLPVLEGLSQIHSVKCYHLDVSSDNILIREEDGTPVLLDFGSARHVQEDRTAPSTVFLKPGFASVEQYSETDTMKVGPWTDIYAISALAYLLVTGNMPVISVARVLKDQLAPLSVFSSPELPAKLLKVIEAGLSVEPSQRPQNVDSFIDSLKKAAMKGVPKQPGSDAETEARPSFKLRPFLDLAANGMAAIRARLPKLHNVQTLIRAGLGKMRGWGSTAHKAVLAALTVMSAGMLGTFTRLGEMLARSAKFIGKVLSKAGDRMKAGMGWLFEAVVSVALKTRDAATNGAFWNHVGKLSKKIFARIGRKPYWGVIGAGLLLLALGLFLSFPKEEAIVITELDEPLPQLADSVDPIWSDKNGGTMSVLPPPPPPSLPSSLPASLPSSSPASPPASPPPLPSDVQVAISVKPWGDIYINGVKKGTAPPTFYIKVSEIAVGSNRIEIRNESGKTYVQDIVVKRGQRNLINHVFK